MITLTKHPAGDNKVLRIQNWLKAEEASNLRELILGEVASLQEESSRVLIQSIENQNLVADAQSAAAKANDLVKFISFLDKISKGEYEFQRIQIGVSNKALWK
jgi:hypothetical protein